MEKPINLEFCLSQGLKKMVGRHSLACGEMPADCLCYPGERAISREGRAPPYRTASKGRKEAVSACGEKEGPSTPHGLPVTTWLPQRRGLCWGKILMEREQSGPPRCGQKAEEPGNERGHPGQGSGAQRQSNQGLGRVRQEMGDRRRRPRLSWCLSTENNDE